MSLPRKLLDRPKRSPFAPPKPEPLPVNGIDAVKPPSVRAARLTKIGFRIVLGLILIALVINIGQNIVSARKAAAGAPADAGVNADDARTRAAIFAADYLSHDPAAPTGATFAGTAYLVTDLVLPGAVTQLDETHAVVAVQARVTIAIPSNPEAIPAPSTTAAAPPPGRVANKPLMPAGYKITATQWLSLSVPVVQQQSGGTVQIGSTGPVFSADPPPQPAPAAVSDPTATEDTRDWVNTLFTAYGQSSTASAYLSAPGVSLQGLSGAVTPTEIQTWSLSAADTNQHRTGTARVGWTFAPTADLTVAQTYRITVETDDNRWYVTALGTSTTQ